MQTQIIPFTRESFASIIEQLQQWGCVALPTETIYGLFADATDEDAVRAVFLAKGRPSSNPVIIHADSIAMIEQYATIQSPLERLLLEKLTPWPFTIALQKQSTLADSVTAWLETVCVRIPDHHLLRQLIHDYGRPLAWPSANTSGKPSPSSAAMVKYDMDGKISLIADGGKTLYGIESTVVVVEGDTIRILRPGYITDEDIRAVLDEAGSDAQIQIIYDDKWPNISPGSRFTHYAPQGKVTVVDSMDMLQKYFVWQSESIASWKIALIATDEFLADHDDAITSLHSQYGLITMPRWSTSNLLRCAQSLYQLYHDADRLGITQIFIQKLPHADKGVGYAIMNRVWRSAEVQ